jgi:formylglycine-generating enzyme required for sulfatase activity
MTIVLKPVQGENPDHVESFERLLSGGSGNSGSWGVTYGYRYYDSPSMPDRDFGFRLARNTK